jgi:hypothetical protein
VATRNFNVKNGLTAGNITLDASTNTTTTSNLVATANVSFTGANVSVGNVSNLKITGGSANAILITDGAGNLSFASSTTGYVHTQSVAATTWTVTHNLGIQYVNVQLVDATGNSWTGRYNYPTITFNNTSALTVTFDSAQAGYAAVTSGGGAVGPAGGSNTQVLFNDAGNANGSANFTFNKTSNTLSLGNALSVTGNANVGNLGTSGLITATGNITGGNLSGTLVTGTLTTAAQPNITSVGQLTGLSTSGTVSIYSVANNNFSTGFNVYKRGNTTDANGLVVSGAELGYHGFYGYDGTTYARGAYAISQTTENWSATAHGTKYAIATTPNGSTTNAVRLTVEQNGNITIVGNTSVGDALAVTGNANVGNLGTAGLITATGNITGGNILTSAAVIASTLTSNVATGTAPLTVTSTTRVANLNVNYANVSDFNVVTTQTTGVYYPTFVSGNTTANYALGSNTAFSANLANGHFAATLLGGTLTTGNQSNITTVGTLTSISMATNASITLSGLSSQITGANLISGNFITGTLTTATQPNITSVGTLTSLSVTGNITGGNLIGTFANGTSNIAIPTASGNINITAAGGTNELVITSTGINVTGTLNATGNANVGNIGATNANVTAITATGNANVGNLGTGALVATGNVTFTGPNVSLGSVSNLKITGGSANAILITDGAGNLSFVSSTTGYVHTQSVSSATWTVTHNLGVQYVNVQLVDATGNSWTGRYNYPTITFNNTTTLTVTFDSAQTGYAAVTSGGGQQGPSGSGGSNIANGTSNVNIATSGGNVTTSVGNVANVFVVTTTGANVTGTLNSTGGLVRRVNALADGTSITINADTTDMATQINTQVTGTLTINAPTGTPLNGQMVMLRIKSSNVQTFSWNSIFDGSSDLALPTATSGSSLTDYLGFIYDSTAIKWQLIAKNFGF